MNVPESQAERGLPSICGMARRFGGRFTLDAGATIARRDLDIHDATAPAKDRLAPLNTTTRRSPGNTAIMASGRAPSSTPVPTTETAESAGATSTVTVPEWEAMGNFLKNVYNYRIDEYALTHHVLESSRLTWEQRL